MNVLGISAFYHDSAACLVRDGVVVAAAQEERFNRVKNASGFPIEAINYCVQAGGISVRDVDEIGYFEKPYLKFSRVLLDHLASWPFSFRGFMRSMPKWLDERLTVPLIIENELTFTKRPFFTKHHLAHAASAFLPSPFEQAAIMTIDGVGEWATFTVGTGTGSDIRILKEVHYPDSLGLLYTAATTFLGFEANEGEGKTMGLAGFGEPSFLPKLRSIVQIRSDGSFRLDPAYFSFRRGSRMWSRKFIDLFGDPRAPGTPIAQRHKDFAASVQALLEEIVIGAARALHAETRLDRLCLAGGVSLNCLANRKILEETPFREIHIQPAAGDAGGALGVALYVSNSILGLPRKPLESAFLGPSFEEPAILKALKSAGVAYKKLDEAALVSQVARSIRESRIVGWFNGRMEFGPRALGNRSILANPCDPQTKFLLNTKVKKRESFRPYAPITLKERSSEFFELSCASPYMLLAPRVRPEKRRLIPAATHVDGTARVQTVDEAENPRMRQLLLELDRVLGVPMVINTSFNRVGEPVVCTPEQAIDCFQHTEMDGLAIGDYWLEKGSPDHFPS